MHQIMKITYYPITPLSREKPTTVWRFFDEDGKSPEMYKPRIGWVADDRLFLSLMNGEISDSDIITEEKAIKIIKDIELG